MFDTGVVSFTKRVNGPSNDYFNYVDVETFLRLDRKNLLVIGPKPLTANALSNYYKYPELRNLIDGEENLDVNIAIHSFEVLASPTVKYALQNAKTPYVLYYPMITNAGLTQDTIQVHKERINTLRGYMGTNPESQMLWDGTLTTEPFPRVLGLAVYDVNEPIGGQVRHMGGVLADICKEWLIISPNK